MLTYVSTNTWGRDVRAHVCMRTHTHTPPPPERSRTRGRASFQNQPAWRNGCDSTKPRLNQQWADCLVTVTNDLMWKRRDQMCVQQGPPGACTCQTTGLLGGGVGRWLPRARAAACDPVSSGQAEHSWVFLGPGPGYKPCPHSLH